MIQHPGWAGNHIGFQPFPTELRVHGASNRIISTVLSGSGSLLVVLLNRTFSFSNLSSSIVREGCQEHSMRKVIRGYARDKDSNLILIGTIPAPQSKDKRSPAARQDKRFLVRQGATIFKKEIIVSAERTE